MPKKKTRLDRFADLTWSDIEEWAGGRIVSRGKTYQRQGRVSKSKQDDDRLKLLEDENRDDEPNDDENAMSGDMRQDSTLF
jgi:integrase